MTTRTLIDRAGKLGLPITMNFYSGTIEDEVPPLPYLVYLIPTSVGRGADMVNNLVEESFDLELYTVADDADADGIRTEIEKNVFPDTGYTKQIAYIHSEECWQTAYEVKGLLRRTKGARK